MATKPTMVLKFGGIKSVDYAGNPEALSLSNQIDYESKEDQIKLIEAYNGLFYSWWDKKYISKQQAKNYVLNYGKEI